MLNGLSIANNNVYFVQMSVLHYKKRLRVTSVKLWISQAERNLAHNDVLYIIL